MKRKDPVWYVCRATDYIQGIYVESPSRCVAKAYAAPHVPGNAHMLTEPVPAHEQVGLVIHRADGSPPRVATEEQQVEEMIRVYGGEND